MKIHLTCIFISFSLLFAPSLHSLSTLSTQSRWIVDTESSTRVKLSCGNWVGHMEPMIPEGLDKQPIDKIADKMNSLGFNCVRLTWATYMYTKSSQLKVEDSLISLNLLAARDGIRKNNPNFLGMTVVDAQVAVVEALGSHGIMVILDNHVSKPQWCCSTDDGNGWFGEQFFDPNEWLKGLEFAAIRYKGNRKVVGMSLRNEIRGSHQDQNVWKNFMQQGVDTVHNANPDVLVIVSGLNYDNELGFLRDPAMRINLPNKLVYEIHQYAFSSGSQHWIDGPLNQVCGRVMRGLDNVAGYLINGKDSVPLFVSEFGGDQRGINEADNRFMPCMLAYMAERDLDWALWAFHGSYYVRSGEVGMEEMYGTLDGSWSYTRNTHFEHIFELPQMKTQEPQSKSAWYYVLYHPLTGNCAHPGAFGKVKIGNCHTGRSKWSHDATSGRIRLLDTPSQCLKVAGEGQTIQFTNGCSSPETQWSILSDSMLHIGAKDGAGTQLCMEGDKTHTIISKKCICIDGNDINCKDDPRTQWFKLVPSNV